MLCYNFYATIVVLCNTVRKSILVKHAYSVMGCLITANRYLAGSRNGSYQSVYNAQKRKLLLR